MNLESVREFIQLAKEEGVNELKYEQKDFKIYVNFNSSVPVSQVQAAPSVVNPVTTTSQVAPVEDKSLHTITSPFVGTYYAQSTPGSAPYAKVGDKISKGQTLCILEAMKIMNEIESDVSGEVVEVCVDNESLVEYGQALFKVRV